MMAKLKICRKCQKEFSGNGFSCISCKKKRDEHYTREAKMKRARIADQQDKFCKKVMDILAPHKSTIISVNVSSDFMRGGVGFIENPWRVEIILAGGESVAGHGRTIEIAARKVKTRLLQR
jgi:hypothetical protein